MEQDKNSIAIFRKTVGGGTRVSLYAISISVTLFLTIYNQMVCPFLESLFFFEELRNLLITNVVMLVLRELLYLWFPRKHKGHTEARHAYKINILSWFISGVLAVVLHEYLYGAAFPWHSGLKILSGYWIMGGGIIAQLEYALLERKLRRISAEARHATSFLEHVSHRIIESSIIFITAPVAATIIMVGRYVVQDKLIPRDVAIEVSFLGVVFLLLALLVSVMYGKYLRKDTKEIVTALTHVKKGNFNISMDETRTDELGAMASGINEMTEGLRQREKIRSAFGRFVNPEIAKEFIELHGDEKKDVRTRGEIKNIAVLMSDIRGFTSMSQTLPPQTITAMLNHYFSAVVAVINKEGGIVDKFVGDAVMALFGVTNSDKAAEKAVRAAIGMRAALTEVNKEFVKKGYPQLKCGTGVHYGPVVAGYLGSEDRLEYTVIGPVVNQASRLCDVAREPKPPIIFSAEIAEHVKTIFNVASVGEAELKGIGKLPLFSVKKSSK